MPTIVLIATYHTPRHLLSGKGAVYRHQESQQEKICNVSILLTAKCFVKFMLLKVVVLFLGSNALA